MMIQLNTDELITHCQQIQSNIILLGFSVELRQQFSVGTIRLFTGPRLQVRLGVYPETDWSSVQQRNMSGVGNIKLCPHTRHWNIIMRRIKKKTKNEFFNTRMYSSYKKVSHEQLYPFLRNWCRLTNRILGEREVLSVEVRVINEHFAEHLGLICLESLLGLTKIIINTWTVPHISSISPQQIFLEHGSWTHVGSWRIPHIVWSCGVRPELLRHNPGVGGWAGETASEEHRRLLELVKTVRKISSAARLQGSVVGQRHFTGWYQQRGGSPRMMMSWWLSWWCNDPGHDQL